MRKYNGTTQEKSMYCIDKVIDDIALISSSDTGKSALVDTRTNKLINEIDNYENKIDKDEHYFYQKRMMDIADDTCTVKRNSEKIEVISIYDTLNKKMVIEDCQVIMDRIYSGSWIFRNYAVIKSLKNEKYYIFDSKLYRKNPDIINRSFDNVERISDRYYLVTDKNRKGIFNLDTGILYETEYDNIEVYNDKWPYVYIFTKGKEKYFTSFSPDNKLSTSYDDITIENIDKECEGTIRIFYCKKEDNIKVFLVFDRNKSNKSISLLQFNCDDIKYFNHVVREDIIDTADGEYYFITIKDGKKGLVKCVIKNSQNILFKNMSDPIYDDIICKDRNFLLYKDGKIDIIRDESYFNEKYYSKPSNMNGKMYYNNIYSLYGYDHVDIIDNGFYVLCKDGRTYITGIKMSYSLVDIDAVVDIYKNNVIYEKNGRYSIYTSYESGIINSDIGWYDNITHLGAGYFEVTTNGKKGIWHDDKLIITPKYEKIELHGDYMKNYTEYNVSREIPGYSCKYLEEKNKLENSEYVFFVLKSRGLISKKIKNQLVKTSDNDTLVPINMNAEKVEFLENVIVVHSNNSTYIYNYKGELAMMLPCNSSISYIEYKYKYKDYNEMIMYTPIYVIDGEYYLYTNETNTFKKTNVIMDDSLLYMTAYETEYGTVVVNSYNKEEHDRKCKEIESMGEFGIEETMLSYYDDSDDIKENYPRLVKKR